DRFLVEVCQQLMREPRHADFGVTHGCGGVAVHGAEVALPVHERVAQGEALRHAHDGFVNGGVAVRVVLTDDVTDHAGTFLVGFVPVVGELCHGKKHTAMHWFEAVPDVRQGPADDHAHGVIEVGLAHFAFDGDRLNLFLIVCHACYFLTP